MIHFGEQNGPFCDVKWLVLKIWVIFSAFENAFFCFLMPFYIKKRKKNLQDFSVMFVYNRVRKCGISLRMIKDVKIDMWLAKLAAVSMEFADTGEMWFLFSAVLFGGTGK